MTNDDRQGRQAQDPHGAGKEPDRAGHKKTPESKPVDPRLPPHDPPAGLPDMGAPGAGGAEMPGGAITGGDDALSDDDKKKK